MTQVDELKMWEQQGSRERLPLHQIFEWWAEQTPTALAIVSDGGSMCYQDLNVRANQLAHYLQRQGVGPETPVVLCTSRSLEFVIGMLGILKAGGAYIPIDAATPPERLAFFLEDTHTSIVLTEERLDVALSHYRGQRFFLGGEDAIYAHEFVDNPVSGVDAYNLAYIIYTSGSTGLPKGVQIQHEGLTNLLHWHQQAFHVTSVDRASQVAGISFDAAGWEIWPYLVSGASVHFVDEETRITPAKLQEWLLSHEITIGFLPTPLMESVLALDWPTGSPLRCLLTGGDKLHHYPLPSVPFSIVNNYGPTENTVITTSCLLPAREVSDVAPPIGPPIANMTVYVLDQWMQPVQAGVSGELFIGGIGLARGYFKRPDLTADRFLPDPFGKEAGARLYRTGDLVRYQPNGVIEFLERVDSQVKIRGFRIELGEIETLLGNHIAIRDVVVLAREDAFAEKQLVAYIVPAQSSPLSVHELRSYLRQHLPSYMLPSEFVWMGQFPLTLNGKIDRRKLPAPKQYAGSDARVAPRTPEEEIILGIWRDVMHVERLGVSDDFFDLGGYSLQATQIVARMRQAFTISLPLQQFFQTPTVAALAQHIDQYRMTETSHALPALAVRSAQEHLPLSFAQERLWFLHQLAPTSAFYNIPSALHIYGPLQLAVLERSLNTVVQRHEVLRTTFPTIGGLPTQIIAAEQPIAIRQIALGDRPTAQRLGQALQIITEQASVPFDLAGGPLICAVIVQVAEQEYVFLVNMHHSVTDGWSMGLLFHEVEVCYQAYSAGSDPELPLLTIQYADYACWQRQWLQSAECEAQLTYWKQQLHAAPPLIQLPIDHPRADTQTFRGATHSMILSNVLVNALGVVSRQEKATLFMTLVAAFNVLLLSYSHQEDVLIGTPVASRTDVAIEKLIGFFVNTLVLRTNLAGDPSFREVLQRVRAVALDAYAHQDLPFDQLINALHPQRDIAYNPIFQVIFALQDAPNLAPLIEGIDIKPVTIKTETALFDLTMEVTEGDEGFSVSATYNVDLFESATIQQLLLNYERLLQLIARDPDQHLQEFSASIISPEIFTTQTGTYSFEVTENVRVARTVSTNFAHDDEVFQLPRTPLEEILVDIWSKVLKRSPISVHDNFFDVGGYSLLVAQVVSRIQETLQRTLSVRAIFQAPTVAALARYIEQNCLSETSHTLPAIVVRPLQEHLPLSFAQERLWFLHQLAPTSAFYNVPIVLRIRGPLQLTVLERSLNTVIQRHEVLRTTFSAIAGLPTQIIVAEQPIAIRRIELGEGPADLRLGQAVQVITEQARVPFDLASEPLIRAVIVQVAEQEYVFLVNTHHSVTDGLSMGLLFHEVEVCYQAYSAGSDPELPLLTIQYADYACWQQQGLQSEELEAQLVYWKQQLDAAPPLLFLPIDKLRPAIQSFQGATFSTIMPAMLTRELKQLSRYEGTTLFMTLLAAFQVLLYRYSGQDDLVIGTPAANRTRPEVENLIGLFANSLVLRTPLTENPSFRELLKRVRDVVLDAYAHQSLPFDKLVQELHPERDLSYNPIFQVMFTLQNTASLLQLPQLQVESLDFEWSTAQFDLTLTMEETEGGLKASFEYDTSLFEAETIKRMMVHLQILLDGIVMDASQRISVLPLLTDDERHQLLMEHNNTGVGYAYEQPFHRLFEQQAAQCSDAVAVVFADELITYGELNRCANQLAHYLCRQGVGPEIGVGICMERSLEIVISMLAVLKAGGAYIPLDPAYPAARLETMLKEANVSLILTQEQFKPSLSHHHPLILSLDTSYEELMRESDENVDSTVCAENIALILYTSGSTGKPKGVMVTHQGMCNRLQWWQSLYPLSLTDAVLQLASSSFDVATLEIFTPLISGAQLILAKPGGQLDSIYLVHLINEYAVTVVNFVPALLQVFLQEPAVATCTTLRYVLSGGEVLPVELKKKFLHTLSATLYNMYGPTEISVDATFYRCRDEETGSLVPIGTPIANTEAYLLDRFFQPVPVGVAGELYIGGVGVARGYLHQPGLTAERFLPHPFAQQPGARLYKTGDVGRYLPDGNIEYLGRSDTQIKLRGMRIELDEIEVILAQHVEVRQALVIVREDIPGLQRLVSYVETDTELSTQELRRYLQQKLPDYMIPTVFMQLHVFPYTINGKVDQQALPIPTLQSELTNTFTEPRTPIEEILAAIWAEVFGLERLSVHENFFDAGGHSLLATQVISRIHDIFLVTLPIKVIFQAPTVAGLAEELVYYEASPGQIVMIAQLYKQVNAMSDDEALAVLQQRKDEGR